MESSDAFEQRLREIGPDIVAGIERQLMVIADIGYDGPRNVNMPQPEPESLSSLATRSGLSPTAISRWKRGATPDLKSLIRLAHHIPCELDAILIAAGLTMPTTMAGSVLPAADIDYAIEMDASLTAAGKRAMVALLAVLGTRHLR